MGKIISFINQKGGVGKTTTCVNMSAYLAIKGYKVLLLDLDPQGNASISYGFDKKDKNKTIYDAIIDDVSINDVIKETKITNLSLIPSDVDLAGAEIELVKMNNREKILRSLLRSIKDNYDFICIDCPPSLGLLTINALTTSDTVLIPIQCQFLPLDGLSQLMYTVKLVKKHLNEGLEIEGVVLTMRDSRSNLEVSVAEELRKYFKDKLYKTVIPKNIRLAEAPSYGEPIATYDRKCAGAVAYRELTDEFVKNQKKYKKGE